MFYFYSVIPSELFIESLWSLPVLCFLYPKSIRFVVLPLVNVPKLCLSCTAETHSCSSYAGAILQAADSKRSSTDKLPYHMLNCG